MAISSCMYLQALIISIGLLLGLASMLVAGEAPSSGYRVELIHVDANANFTREELISRAVDRARLREAMLSPAATDGDGTTTTTKVVEAHFSHYEYLVELETDEKKFFVVADTGSDVVWMKQQSSPDFGSVPCGCTEGVSKKRSQCCSSKVYTFNKTYGTGMKAAKGFMCRNKVTLSRLMADEAITMGIAIDYADHMLPASAHGILGLNQGKLSLLQQLKETKFSYCLSDPILEPKRKNLFWFGGDVVDSTWQSTPLVQMPKPSDMYLIALLGISIGDGSGEYKKLPKDKLKHKSEQGDGVMFVDSGSTHTSLEKPFFSELVSLLQGELEEGAEFIPKKDKFIPDKCKVFTCFSGTNGKKPTLAFHLKEGKKGAVTMRIPWNNYMVWDKAESKFCLTINTAEASVPPVMGNILQHDIRMHFDVKQKDPELSFKPVTDCTMEQ